MQIVIKIKLMWIYQRRIILHNQMISNKLASINTRLLMKKRIKNKKPSIKWMLKMMMKIMKLLKKAKVKVVSKKNKMTVRKMV